MTELKSFPLSQQAVICGTGGYLPQQILSNDALIAKFNLDSDSAWIEKRTGITQRHVAAEDETTSDMATAAARQALEKAGITGADLDAIIVATTTPDRVFPSTAAYVQAKLGMSPAGFAFDVQAVCSGFAYAFAVANGLVQSGQARRVLVIGAEIMTRLLDWQDRTTSVLFGDGAGAVVLEARNIDPSIPLMQRPGILTTTLHSDGANADLLYVDGGVCQPDPKGYLRMQGREVFKHAVTRLAETVDTLIAKAGCDASDIDYLVPHQANARIITATADKLGLPMDRVVMTIAQHANTSAASVPLALHHGVEADMFKSGDLLLLEAMGAGLTWGGALVRWS